jgi:hypothetical protein
MPDLSTRLTLAQALPNEFPRGYHVDGDGSFINFILAVGFVVFLLWIPFAVIRSWIYDGVFTWTYAIGLLASFVPSLIFIALLFRGLGFIEAAAATFWTLAIFTAGLTAVIWSITFVLDRMRR